MLGGRGHAMSWVAGVVLLTDLALAPRARAQDRVVVAWDETLSGPSFVRAIEADPDGGDQIPGLAVRFTDLGDELLRRLEEFVVAGGFGEAQD